MLIEPRQIIDDSEVVYKQREAYENAIDENFARWERQYPELLKGFPEERLKQVASILENQTMFAQTSMAHIGGKSVELVKKILDGFLGFDLVTIKSTLGPTSRVFFSRFVKEGEETTMYLRSEDIAAKTRNVTSYSKPEIYDEDFLNNLAREIRNKMFREITTDLRNNVGSVAGRVVNLNELTYEEICANLAEMNIVIWKNTLIGGINWIVTGLEIGEKIAAGMKVELEMKGLDPVKIGKLDRSKVIVDPLFPAGEMLVGRCPERERELLGGYFYCPYVMITETPIISLDSGPRHGIMTRYGKRLTIDGSKTYGKIKYTSKGESE